MRIFENKDWKKLSDLKITDSFLTPYNISYLPFCDKENYGFIFEQSFSIPNNPERARTELPNKSEKYIWT